jgi:hypothetical protein
MAETQLSLLRLRPFGPVLGKDERPILPQMELERLLLVKQRQFTVPPHNGHRLPQSVSL